MALTGTVVNGMVVFDPGESLPEGTKVTVEPLPAVPTDLEPGPHAWILKYAGTVDLPPDFAYQHDHYIHGTPKRPPPTPEDSTPDPESIAILQDVVARMRERERASDLNQPPPGATG